MNCRVIICAFALVLQVVGAVTQARESVASSGNGVAADAINWSALQSPQMEIQDFSSGEGDVRSTYPVFLQAFYTRLMDWEPRVNSSSTEESCRLSFSSNDLKVDISQIKQFQTDKPECVFKAGASGAMGLWKLTRALSVRFDVSDANHFRKVIFKLKSATGSEIQARGLLGLHDLRGDHPLVILRLGVHGNVDEFLAERYIGKLAYEDFGYNILVLENLTSHGYLSKENPITFAGVEEGLHTFEILRMLKNKNFPLSQFISDIHLFGISLGAHGVFVTTMLDELNQKYLKSTTAFCPMINLENTMNFHSKSSFAEAGVDVWNRMRLRALPNRVPELQNTGLWKTFFDFKPRFMPAILDYLQTHQIAPSIHLSDGIVLPKNFQHHLQTSKSFFELNNFWPYYENNSTPFLIVTTPKDPLVPLELNTDLVVQKKQNGRFEKTEILQLDRGVHCALPTEYNWNFIVDLMKVQWK